MSIKSLFESKILLVIAVKSLTLELKTALKPEETMDIDVSAEE